MPNEVVSFLWSAFREVIPIAKEYYMADLDGKIAARNIEIGQAKVKESLEAIHAIQLPQQAPAGTLEAKMVQQMEILDPKKAVGRATWNVLHTKASYFADQPTPEQSEAMRQFIVSTVASFPCSECAQGGMAYIEANPIDASSRAALVAWTCNFHNAVNAHLGKPVFDCQTL